MLTGFPIFAWGFARAFFLGKRTAVWGRAELCLFPGWLGTWGWDIPFMGYPWSERAGGFCVKGWSQFWVVGAEL